jgi:hypothetical protein
MEVVARIITIRSQAYVVHLVSEQEEYMNYRDKRITCWASNQEELWGKFSGFPVHLGTNRRH